MLQSFKIQAITSSGSPIKSSDYHKGIFIQKLIWVTNKNIKNKKLHDTIPQEKKNLIKREKEKGARERPQLPQRLGEIQGGRIEREREGQRERTDQSLDFYGEINEREIEVIGWIEYIYRDRQDSEACGKTRWEWDLRFVCGHEIELVL